MLFTYTLFLVYACCAIASPWNLNHYHRHHQHLTEIARSDSINAAASPIEAPAPLPEKILASRQSDQDEDEYDECSDEDEDGSTQPQAAQAAPPLAQNQLNRVPGPGNPDVAFTNATFPAAQVIAVSSSAAAPAPSPPASNNLVTNPSSGDGVAQQDGVGRPLQINVPSSGTAPAAAATSTAAAGGGDSGAGTLIASFTRYMPLPPFPFLCSYSAHSSSLPNHLQPQQLRRRRSRRFRKLQYRHRGLRFLQQPRLQRRHQPGRFRRWAWRWCWARLRHVL